MGELQFAFNFRTTDCCNCGCVFALSADLYQRRLDDGLAFWCPNGHSQHFTTSTVAKLKKELEETKAKADRDAANARKQLEWANNREAAERKAKVRATRKASAFKGILTKTKNRIANGVCPCCNRTFQNLMGHMATQHPEYKGDKKK